MIILKRRSIELECSARVGYAGRFNLVKKKRGVVVQEIGWFDNLILDTGLNRWGTGGIITGAEIGTSNSPVDALQTGLQGVSVRTTTSTPSASTYSAGTAPDYVMTRQVGYRFAEGTLNGTYAEVGVGWAANNCFSRALIQDGLGPTTINVAIDESLDVYYQLLTYPPTSDVLGVRTISGADYNYLLRANAVTSYSSSGFWDTQINNPMQGFTGTGPMTCHPASNVFGGIESSISGSGQSSSSSETNLAYSSGSYQRDMEVSFGLTEGNVSGGAKYLTIRFNNASFKVQFDTPLPKDSTKVMTLGARISWGRRP